MLREQVANPDLVEAVRHIRKGNSSPTNKPPKKPYSGSEPTQNGSKGLPWEVLGIAVIACAAGICGTLLLIKWLTPPQRKNEGPLVPVANVEEKKTPPPMDLPEEEPRKANPPTKSDWAILKEKATEMLAEMAKAQQARFEERWRRTIGNCDKVIKDQEMELVAEKNMAKEEFALLSEDERKIANQLVAFGKNPDPNLYISSEEIRFALGVSCCS